MHVRTRQIALLGLLAAFVTVCMVLSSVIESNTLFLLAAAAFLLGVAIRETNLGLGVGFYIVCVFLGGLLAPNKLYVLTYAVLSLYILIREAARFVLSGEKFDKSRRILFWIIRFLVFNLIYIPALIFFPALIYPGKISMLILAGLIAAGQAGWIIYDIAYDYFLNVVWNKLKKKTEAGR